MKPPAIGVLAALLTAGCVAPGLQAGLDTAGTIVDTAAVVRARQLGLCGAAPARPLATPDDVIRMQAEIAVLQADLSTAQGQLTRLAVERARLPQYALPALPPPPPPRPSSTLPPIPALPPPPLPTAAPR